MATETAFSSPFFFSSFFFFDRLHLRFLPERLLFSGSVNDDTERLAPLWKRTSTPSSVSILFTEAIMEIMSRENENAFSGLRPMELSTVPHGALQGQGKQRTSSLEAPIMLLTGHPSVVYTMIGHQLEPSRFVQCC